ncbi:MAG: hypothetical protein AB8V23_01565 [Candidatus Midichloria sp.]|nr:flagellar biosynthesis protein FlgL [Hyalomma marginatum]
MVNSAYISKMQPRQLSKSANDLYSARQKDYTNPDSGFTYKAPTWSGLTVNQINEIVNIEATSAKVRAEEGKLYDIENKVNVVINILDSIEQIVTKVKAQLTEDNNYDRITSLNQLRHIGENALKAVVALCNSKSSNGDYVMSGNQIKIKPLEESDLSYNGGTSNLSLSLKGQYSGEIEVRADNVAIKNILDSFQQIASKKEMGYGKINQVLDESFNEVVRLRLGAAMFLQEIKYLKDKYQLDSSNLMSSHQEAASQSDIEYAEVLRSKENQYDMTLEITKKFLKNFDYNRG